MGLVGGELKLVFWLFGVVLFVSFCCVVNFLDFIGYVLYVRVMIFLGFFWFMEFVDGGGVVFGVVDVFG